MWSISVLMLNGQQMKHPHKNITQPQACILPFISAWILLNVKKGEKHFLKKGKHLRNVSAHWYMCSKTFTCSCITAFDLIKLSWMLSTLQSHSFLLFAHRQERPNSELSNLTQRNSDPEKKKIWKALSAYNCHSGPLSPSFIPRGISGYVDCLRDHPSCQGGLGRAQHH